MKSFVLNAPCMNKSICIQNQNLLTSFKIANLAFERRFVWVQLNKLFTGTPRRNISDFYRMHDITSYFYFCLAKYFKQQTILFIFSQNDKAYLIETATKYPKFVWVWTIIRYLEKADVIHECSLFRFESVEATRWVLITWPDWSLESWLLHMCSRRAG